MESEEMTARAKNKIAEKAEIMTGDLPKQVAALPMGGRAYWLIFSEDGKTAYVSVRSTGEVAVVDVAKRKITARIPVGKEPKRLMLVTPGGKTPSNG